MKIINVIENLDDTYGGPAKSVPYMCKYLEDIDVDTQILSICLKSNEKNSLVERYKLNWKIFNYNFFKSFRYSVDMKRYIKNTTYLQINLLKSDQPECQFGKLLLNLLLMMLCYIQILSLKLIILLICLTIILNL